MEKCPYKSLPEVENKQLTLNIYCILSLHLSMKHSLSSVRLVVYFDKSGGDELIFR